MTEEDIDKIAERAADKAVKKAQEQFFVEIGKSVVYKGLWVVGVVVAFLGYVIYNHGWPR